MGQPATISPLYIILLGRHRSAIQLNNNGKIASLVPSRLPCSSPSAQAEKGRQWNSENPFHDQMNHPVEVLNFPSMRKTQKTSVALSCCNFEQSNFQDFSFSGLTSLERLELSDCRIWAVGERAFAGDLHALESIKVKSLGRPVASFAK